MKTYVSTWIEEMSLLIEELDRTNADYGGLLSLRVRSDCMVELMDGGICLGVINVLRPTLADPYADC